MILAGLAPRAVSVFIELHAAMAAGAIEKYSELQFDRKTLHPRQANPQRPKDHSIKHISLQYGDD